MAQYIPIDVNQVAQPISQLMVVKALQTMAASMSAVFMGMTAEEEDTAARKKSGSLRSINVNKLDFVYAQIMQEGRTTIKRVVDYGGDLSMETQLTPRQFQLLQALANAPLGRLEAKQFIGFDNEAVLKQDLYSMQSLGLIYVSWRQKA